MSTWIVSAGDQGRDYTQDFFRFGMAFVGGEPQRRAMKQVHLGDAILLKRGLSEFVAAGKVVQRDGLTSGDGDKKWLRDFDGWDLSGGCYVEWHVPDKPEPATGLKIGTIYQTHQPQHLAVLDRLLLAPEKESESEPAETRKVDDDTLLRFLIRCRQRGLGVPVSPESPGTRSPPGGAGT